jgi:hypothetical protein
MVDPTAFFTVKICLLCVKWTFYESPFDTGVILPFHPKPGFHKTHPIFNQYDKIHGHELRKKKLFSFEAL